MPVPDTSVLVPIFDADHPLHEKARAQIGAPVLLHVTGGVLAELTTVLRRRGNDVGLDGSRIARECLGELEQLRGFRHASPCDGAEVTRVFKAHSSLSYVDAWGIVLALELGDTIITFDERQASAFKREKARQ
ncbi:MAG: PIN domain-containing protein [Candidatus Thermoplasmatota archaeon]|jgi:predicted nucleic acid-binding protein